MSPASLSFVSTVGRRRVRPGPMADDASVASPSSHSSTAAAGAAEAMGGAMGAVASGGTVAAGATVRCGGVWASRPAVAAATLAAVAGVVFSAAMAVWNSRSIVSCSV